MAKNCLKCLNLQNELKYLLNPSRKNYNFYEHRNISSSSACLKLYKMKLTSLNSNRQKELQIQYSKDYVDAKIEEYDLGVQRLARIMGHDPETFTTGDVKKAIKYLFPSGLEDEGSRPQMLNPLDVFPQKLKSQIDKDGHPFHSLFFTLNQDFYQYLHDAYQHLSDARTKFNTQKALASSQIGGGIKEIIPEELNLQRTRWISQEDFENNFLAGTKIKTRLYDQFIGQMERLLEEPFAIDSKDFIMQFRQTIKKEENVNDNINKIEIDGNGREYVIEKGAKKTALAEVKLISGGSGNITINEEDFEVFFPVLADRQALISPFSFLRIPLTFDVDATVDGGFSGVWSMLNGQPTNNRTSPKSSMAVAIRHAIARGLRSFLEDDKIELLRRGGLLTLDVRTRERKWYGQVGARRKYTWKKR